MIEFRRVLCSFDCDSAQSFLASQMENWKRTIAATQPERPTKVRRNSNVTGSKDDLERQLHLISTRLGLRNARDVSLLSSICYSTVKLPKDHAVCAEARRAHATRTRGKSGHGEDHQTNTLLWERVWLCTRFYRTPTGRTQSKSSSTHTHPKTRNLQLQSAVVECRKPGDKHTSSFISDSALRISRLRRTS